MESRIMQVFYGNDLLPYKDKERTVHYPIINGAIAGSNNVTKIRFYVDQIGGTENVSWVVVSKLPNGKLGYEPISNVQIDEEIGKKYIEFDLSSYYTSVKGDLYLALRGYEGKIEFTDLDEEGNKLPGNIYRIAGDPLIQVTGTIKLPINYSPMVNTGTQVLPTDVDRLIDSLSNYIKVGDGIQIFTATSTTTFAQLYAQTGTKEFILFYNNTYYIGRFMNETHIYMETISNNDINKAIYSKSGLTTSDRVATLFYYANEDMVALGQTTILYTYGSDRDDFNRFLQDLDYYGGHDSTKPFIFKLTSSENDYEGYYLCQADTFGYPNCSFIFRQIDGDKIFKGVVSSYQTNDLRDFFKPEYLFTQTNKEYVDEQVDDLTEYIDNEIENTQSQVDDCIKKLDSLAIDITSSTTFRSLLGTHFIRYNNNLYLCSITQGGANYGFATIIHLDSQTDVVDGIAFDYYTSDAITLNAPIVSMLNSSNAHNIPNTDYVDNKLAEFLQKEYTKVNTTTYPTLNSFLASTGEEGYIYLYPINVSDESQGYYQYIWEGSWVSLGTTQLDLSDYYTKSETDTLLSAKANSSDVYTKAQADSLLDTKQDNLVSGTNIKTLNNESLLGSGNISYDSALSSSSTNAVQNKVITQNVLDLQYRVSLLEEAIISEDTLSYTHLSESLIPQLSDNSYPIIQGAGLDTKEIKGRSFVYNQQFTNFNIIPSWGIASTYWGGLTPSLNSTDKTLTLNGTTTSAGYNQAIGVSSSYVIIGHKYLYVLSLISGSVDISNATITENTQNGYILGIRSPWTNSATMPLTANNSYMRIFTASATFAVSLSFEIGVVFNNAIYKWQIFDLTQSGIDSATTEDEAIALLRQNGINPYEYNEYSAGKIIDSKPTAIVSKGYNLFDGELEGGDINDTNGLDSSNVNSFRTKNYIKVVAGRTYTFEYNRTDLGGYQYISEYDKNKNFIKQSSASSSGEYNLQLSNTTYYVRVHYYKGSSGWGTNVPTNSQVCFHLTGTRTGYAPYKAPITYPLDVPVLRSARNAQDNNLKVNIGVVDLGTLDFSSSNAVGNAHTYTSFSSAKPPVNNNTKANIISDWGINLSYSESWSSQNIVCIASDGQVWVKLPNNPNATENQVKSVLSGYLLYYELATSTDQPSITLPENIEIEIGGSLEVLYDDGHTTPCDITFDTAIYKPIQ